MPSRIGILVVVCSVVVFGARSCMALFRLGRTPGAASLDLPFGVSLSVCTQSEVCGKDGKTYISPCALKESGVEMDCQGSCPCHWNPPAEHHFTHLPQNVIIHEPVYTTVLIPTDHEVTNANNGDIIMPTETPYYISDQHVVREDKCHLAMDSGLCGTDPTEYFVRYHYDASRGDCSPFLYSGCGGNGNNFLSREECQGTCGGKRKRRFTL